MFRQGLSDNMLALSSSVEHVQSRDGVRALKVCEPLRRSDAAPLDAYDAWIYGTHIVPLMACVVESSGPVLELGCGQWSTPLLRTYCLAAKREFVSVECKREWADKIGQALGMSIEFPDLDALAMREWSVVLVDHDPWYSRVADALRFASAEFVLIHDSNMPEIAELLSESLPKWKFHHEYTAANPNTMILSNTRRIPII